MLNIFKNYSAKTSIFDDFEFYENRQKLLHDKRIMQFVPRLEHYQVSICKQHIQNYILTYYYNSFYLVYLFVTIFNVYFHIDNFILSSFVCVFYTIDCIDITVLEQYLKLHFKITRIPIYKDQKVTIKKKVLEGSQGLCKCKCEE